MLLTGKKWYWGGCSGDVQESEGKRFKSAEDDGRKGPCGLAFHVFMAKADSLMREERIALFNHCHLST